MKFPRIRFTLAAALATLLLAARGGLAADPSPHAELHIATDPAGAAVSVDGAPSGVTPLSLSGLAPGDHLVMVTKLGYNEYRQTVTTAADARQSLDVMLEPTRGLVLVTTTPPDARVSVDGADRGSAPLLLTDLPFGRHRLHVEAPDYLSKDVDLNINSRNPMKSVIQLQSSLATIEFRSSPTGAVVMVDGGACGTTPLRLDRLPPGVHQVKVSLTGYRVHEQAVTVASGQTESLNVTLAPISARVQVTSRPAGARIYLDNALKGRAPVTIGDLAPGPYRLRAELPGYATVGRTITLALAAEAVEEFRLESNSGALELTTAPAGVTVFVDGDKVAVTGFGTNATDRVSDAVTVRPLVQGEHSLQLVRKGYFTIEKNIEVTKDETLALHETLKRRFIPDIEIVTDAGVYQGVLESTDADGTLRVEVSPGVMMTFPFRDIKISRPLRQQEVPKIEDPAPSTEPPEPDNAP